MSAIHRIAKGQRFGRLVVIDPRVVSRRSIVRCLCDCGGVRLVDACELLRPTTKAAKSCGCLAGEPHGEAGRGLVTVEYRTWRGMIDRCYRKSNKSFHNYGGRGIRVCLKWRKSFTAFLADMGRKPSGELSIDRINNDGNYEPGNCRRATRKEQVTNQRHRTKSSNGSSRKVADSHDVERVGVLDEAVITLRRDQLAQKRRLEALERLHELRAKSNVVEMRPRVRFARAA